MSFPIINYGARLDNSSRGRNESEAKKIVIPNLVGEMGRDLTQHSYGWSFVYGFKNQQQLVELVSVFNDYYKNPDNEVNLEEFLQAQDLALLTFSVWKKQIKQPVPFFDGTQWGLR